MALKKWIGTTGSSPTVAANWSGGVAPVAGDDVYIGINGTYDHAPVGDATSLGLLNSVNIIRGSGPSIGTSSAPFKFHCKGSVKITSLDLTATTDYIHAAANTTSSPGLTITPDQIYARVLNKSNVYFYGASGSLAEDEAFIQVEGNDAKFYWENKISGEVAGTVGKIYVNNGTGGEIYLGPWGSGALTPALLEMGSQGYNTLDCKLDNIGTVRVLGYESSSSASLANKLSFSNPGTSKSPSFSFSASQQSKITAASSQVVVSTLEASGNKSLTPETSNARILVDTGVRFDHLKLSGSAQLKFSGGILSSTIRNAIIRANHIGDSQGTQGPLIDATDISAGQLTIPNHLETAATATFTFGDTEFDDHADETITLVDAAGTSKTYKIKASSPTASNQEFEDGADASAAATNFKAIVESANGHNGTLTVTVNASAGKVVIAQATKGVAGNTAITHSSNWNAICDVNPPDFFSGGESSGGAQFQPLGLRQNIVPMVPPYSSIRLSWTDING